LKCKQTVAGAVHGKGESSSELCGQAHTPRTRDVSQRQLPTDHDHAVPTREYQSDQPSHLAASATVCLHFRLDKT
jgi:hypothetical protein